MFQTCFTKYMSSNTRKHTWTNDGANGVDDPKTSEQILLDWLMTKGNYTNKWRGKDNNGKKKKHFAAEIASIMNAANVVVLRDAKQVMNKISHIEKAFRSAHDFANTETGQGLLENDKGEFNDAVMKKCQYYFDLLEIFGDRSSAKPKVTSAENLDSSDDDNGQNNYGTYDNYDEEEDEYNSDDNSNKIGHTNADYLDLSFDTLGEEANNNDTILAVDNVPLQLDNCGEKSEYASKAKQTFDSALLSLAGSAASKKRNKGQDRIVTLLDEHTKNSIASLTGVQECVAAAKIDAAADKLINWKLQQERLDLQLRMEKFTSRFNE